MTMTADPAPTPALIAWARRESGHAVERIAKRLQVPPGRPVYTGAGAAR